VLSVHFSERELTFTFAMLSAVRLSVVSLAKRSAVCIHSVNTCFSGKHKLELPTRLLSQLSSRLSVTFVALRAIIGSKSAISLQRGSVNPKFQVEGVTPTNHSFSHKTRINDLSYGVKICTDFSFVLSQCTRLADRQTDGRTDGRTDRQNSHRKTSSAFHAAR